MSAMRGFDTLSSKKEEGVILQRRKTSKIGEKKSPNNTHFFIFISKSQQGVKGLQTCPQMVCDFFTPPNGS